VSGFQPSVPRLTFTWAFGPGWYVVAPLALRVVAGGDLGGLLGWGEAGGVASFLRGKVAPANES
jgi:hypothetical protein